jgi:hypothetical protein|tara:strand:- start:385 stop:576 length:192 start_codon:yes stop_codon:yes gene_type:complete
MSNVIQLFPTATVQLYKVEDPGLTWYEQGEIISETQLQDDVQQLAVESCTVAWLKDEMLLQKL